MIGENETFDEGEDGSFQCGSNGPFASSGRAEDLAFLCDASIINANATVAISKRIICVDMIKGGVGKGTIDCSVRIPCRVERTRTGVLVPGTPVQVLGVLHSRVQSPESWSTSTLVAQWLGTTVPGTYT